MIETAPLLSAEFLAQIERLSLVARGVIVGQLRGERRSKRRGASTEFADYRDYVPGDDLRYLDWNIFGRLERLFIKLFHEEEDLTVQVLVDVSASMAAGDPPKLRYALQVAAALGMIGLATEDRVGIYPFDADLRAPFRPVRGRRHGVRLLRYLETLASAETTGGATHLEPALRSFARVRAPGALVILISDLLDPDGYEGALRALAGPRGEAIVIQVLSPQEVDPPLTGDLRLIDCEDATVREVSIDQPLLSSYRETVQRFRDGIAQACSQRGIASLSSVTSTPFQQLVIGMLRARGLLR